MTINSTFLAVLAGLASGIIFAVSSVFDTGGALLIYVSLFPLLLLGLSQGARRTGTACAAGCITSLVLVQPHDSLFYPLLVALPVMVFLTHALKWRGDDGPREWYPVSTILALLTALAAAIYMCFALLAEFTTEGGLQGVALHELSGSLASSDKDVSAAMKLLLTDWLFLLLAGTAWLWLFALYALALIANNILAGRHLALRPGLTLTPNGLPLWLLGLLGVSAFFAFIGQGSDRLNGETVFLILLLPYFFAGMARIHQLSVRWPWRPFWLTLIYFLLMFPPWMPLVAVVLGLYSQLSEVLDKRPEIG